MRDGRTASPGGDLWLAGVFMGSSLELFAENRFVYTNMILVAVGSTIIGITLLATSVILYSLTALLRGKVKDY